MQFLFIRSSAFFQHIITGGVLALCLFNSQAAYAIDPINEPSQVERRFESQAIEPKRPQVSIVAPEQSKSTHSYKGSFELKSINFRGVTVYDKATLQKMGADLIGKKVTLNDLDSVANALAKRYREDGYLLVVVKVVDKRPKGGVVEIQVVEGYIENVVIDGRMNANESGQKIVSSIAQKITKERPLKAATLERYLLLIDDLPGVTAKGVVRRGKGPGQADLLIVMDHKKYEASLEANNRGTRFIGRAQLQATFVANSLLGWFDRTLVRAVTAIPTKELKFFDIQHEEQLDTEGTKLKLYASHTNVRPGDTLKVSDIEGTSTSFDLRVESPILRSRKENFTPRATLSYRDSDVTVLNVESFDDSLRVVRAGAAYDVEDSLSGVNIFDAELSQGLDIFGASEHGVGRSRIDGKEDFTKINFDISRLQPLPQNFSILTSFTSQYAFVPLLSSEEFSLGGLGFGQAYDPSELTGDHGAAVKIEFRWANSLGKSWLDTYQLYTYYDVGSIWQKDPLPSVVRRQSLASTGLGIRANFNENASGSVEVAKPLTRNVAAEGDDDTRLFFSLIGRF